MSFKKPTVFAMALLVGVVGTAVAAGRQSLNVELRDETSLSGTKLPAGKYKIRWSNGEAQTEVTIEQGRKVVATAKGKRVDRPRPSVDDEVVSRKDASGAYALSEIRLRGEKSVIVL